MNNETLDALILSFTAERFLKVARIIGKVSEHAGEETKLDAIAARVRALVADGKLESKGDLTQWGYSEVRLPSDRPDGDGK